MKNKTPRFIALEGGEGSGKSTLIELLKKKYADQLVVTREPGGSEYAELIREVALKSSLAKDALPETMLCLMFAARYDHVSKLIIPAIEGGKIVVSDRFDASSYAYNVWTKKDKKLEELFWKLRDQISILPDMYIFADVDPAEGIRRARLRNSVMLDGNHFDDRELSFHTKVNEGYKRFLSKVPHVTIDANRPLEDVKVNFLRIIPEMI